MSEMSKHDTMVDPILHTASISNGADILTRGTATVKDILAGSSWWTGPEFLCSPKERWPVEEKANN